MRKSLLLLLLLLSNFVQLSVINAQPALPGECISSGTGGATEKKNYMILNSTTGSNTFIINSVPLLEGSSTEPNNFSVAVKSRDSPYRISIAGRIEYLDTPTPTTNIPLETFSITATRAAGVTAMPAITPISLSDTYQPIVSTTVPTPNSEEVFDFTVTRRPLDTYQQSPGNYRLTIYVCYCWH
ncbi:MAG TPA: hypothetical protein VGE26_10700 [Sphingobacteriaceae bacterium]